MTPSKPSPSTADIAQAKSLWKKGSAAFRRGAFETARASLSDAAKLYPHPALVQSLAEAELRSGHPVDAGRRLRHLLASADLPDEQHEAAEASLEKALDASSGLVLQSQVEGATALLDGEPLGVTPLGSVPLAVPPGTHVVELRHAGYSDAREEVNTTLGRRIHIELLLAPLPSPAAVAANGSAALSEERPAAPEPPLHLSVPETEAASHGSSAKTVVVIAGGVLTLGALTTGVVYAALRSREEKNHEAAAAITSPEPSPGKPADPGQCLAPNAQLAPACTAQATAAKNVKMYGNVSTGAFVAAGVFGAATVVTWWLWPHDTPERAALVPHVDRSGASLTFSGTF